MVVPSDLPGSSADSSASAPPRPSGANRGRRLRTRWIVTLLAVLGGPLVLELAMRFLLFHPGELARTWGAELRDARRYASPMEHDDFWKLRHVFAEGEGHIPGHVPHPELGWLYPRIDALSLRHEQAPDDGSWAGRRPILLYGASFASCKTLPRNCFEGLLERSPGAAEYVMLNYAISGFGAAQVLMFLRSSVDLYTDRNPLVIVGLVMDSDFDRAVLGFRGRPKPRYRAEGTGFTIELPATTDLAAYLETHPVEIRSYAWNHLVYGTELLPKSLTRRLRKLDARREHKEELWRHLLLEFRSELEARELDYLFVLFSREAITLDDANGSWRESFLLGLMEELAIPHMPVKTLMRRASAERDVAIEEFFSPGHGHPTELGNEVVFEALLEANFDPAEITSRYANGSAAALER